MLQLVIKMEKLVTDILENSAESVNNRYSNRTGRRITADVNLHETFVPLLVGLP